MVLRKNILVTTFGATWQIIPELFGFLNHEKYPLFQNHHSFAQILEEKKRHSIPAVDSFYIIHTDSDPAREAIKKVHRWQNDLNSDKPEIRLFSYRGVSELGTPDECVAMADLIYRVVLHARAETNGGALLISITGGRKNMSADIQRARDFFGCEGTVHIADSLSGQSVLNNRDYCSINAPLDQTVISQIYPMIVKGYSSPHHVVQVDQVISPDQFPFQGNGGLYEPMNNLYRLLEKRADEASHLVYNHFNARTSSASQTGFFGLQLLEPELIRKLEQYRIGVCDSTEDIDMQWLMRLPKAELHCHLGGVLTVPDIIDVASSLSSVVLEACKKSSDFCEWLDIIHTHILEDNTEFLRDMIADSKNRIRTFANVAEPYPLAGFVLQFQDKPELLEKLIFGELTDPLNYFAVGIGKYEKLGDLQGSGLLKHPESLRRTCEKLIQRCRKEKIRYCEVRCSPSKYSTSSFPIQAVVQVIVDSFSTVEDIIFRLIFIASRHSDPAYITYQKQYVLNNMNNDRFMRLFAGFDVAGDESIRSPEAMKKDLREMLLRSIKMTIHAGEGEDVNNIWEAVYELNADRIGHGLTLRNNQELLQRFIDRRICVEMCPSSNYQIIGYWDRRYNISHGSSHYPLREYFDAGLRVTVNTDNPGISQTTLAGEFYKAACMTNNGISKWEVLQLIRNSFASAFVPYHNKKQMMLKIERELAELLTGE